MARPIRDPNRKPTTPGAMLLLDVLPALKLTKTEFAKELCVSRVTISELLHGHRALSASLAVRLEKRFGLSARQLLGMQMAVDLWEAQQELAADVADTLELELLVLSAPYTDSTSADTNEVQSAYTTPVPVEAPSEAFTEGV